MTPVLAHQVKHWTPAAWKQHRQSATPPFLYANFDRMCVSESFFSLTVRPGLTVWSVLQRLIPYHVAPCNDVISKDISCRLRTNIWHSLKSLKSHLWLDSSIPDTSLITHDKKLSQESQSWAIATWASRYGNPFLHLRPLSPASQNREGCPDTTQALPDIPNSLQRDTSSEVAANQVFNCTRILNQSKEYAPSFRCLFRLIYTIVQCHF